MEISVIKQRNGFPVQVQQFREAAGAVDVSIDGSNLTMPLDEWRALPLWDGASPFARVNDG